jgi:hypothetical protein
MFNAHFALGACAMAAFCLAFQHALGLTGYVEFVVGHWIDVPGGAVIGAAAVATCIAASAMLERRESNWRFWITEHMRDMNRKLYGTRGYGDDNDKPEWYVVTRWKCAGWLTVGRGCARWEYSVHLLPRRSEWRWGYKCNWFDGPLREFGLGPLLLVCWR